MADVLDQSEVDSLLAAVEAGTVQQEDSSAAFERSEAERLRDVAVRGSALGGFRCLSRCIGVHRDAQRGHA